MKRYFSLIWLTMALTLVGMSQSLFAGQKYKPFIIGDPVGSTVEEATEAVTKKLESVKFKILGGYSPYPDNSAYIIGVTHGKIKKAARRHRIGGFGAVLRVAITENHGKIEVSYTNPIYMGYAYHLSTGPLKQISKLLSETLGNNGEFGANGLDASDLKKYQYMMAMPYFKDAEVVKEYSSHAEARAAVDKILSHPKSDMSKVWELQVSKTQRIFGVQLHRGYWANGKIQKIMAMIDKGSPKATAALPWEILISGSKVYYLPGKFRIALMFPDLGMGTFMEISDVPDKMVESIENAMKLK